MIHSVLNTAVLDVPLTSHASSSPSTGIHKGEGHDLVCCNLESLSRDRHFPGAGDRLLDRGQELQGIQPWRRHRDPAGGDWYRHSWRENFTQCEVGLFPDVPVRRGLRRRSPVRAGHCQGRLASSDLCRVDGAAVSRGGRGGGDPCGL
ncbi:hypothetical protein D3C73_1227010 [compost metagenome]